MRSRFLSFRGQSPSDYLGLGPDLDPRVHLAGRNICDGVIFGPTGRVSSRFRAVMTGSFDGDNGMIEVDFRYDGGAEQHRAWHLQVDDTGRVVAEADDTEGRGRGQIVGPAMQLNYRIRIPEDAGGHLLDVSDWMYLNDSGTIVNRSQFRKGGVLVAELIATISREDRTV
ncbi:DUF3833 family protein [Palleronia sp. THAF1]|uniref:DUF3833 family protein n=1 Tax=Palleronia sp. THAF1 TaxID=2587842 RepID=UPI0020C783F9|nr:DUF3833 family protein [Palleronia sp. THAF1]